MDLKNKVTEETKLPDLTEALLFELAAACELWILSPPFLRHRRKTHCRGYQIITNRWPFLWEG